MTDDKLKKAKELSDEINQLKNVLAMINAHSTYAKQVKIALVNSGGGVSKWISGLIPGMDDKIEEFVKSAIQTQMAIKELEFETL